ncbi:MAG: phenylalanine--tRNA ligase subunit beta [bacterium]
MYIGYNWLKEYVEVPFTPEELAERLTMLGLEIGGISRYLRGLDLCRVALITRIDPHPNADKLCLCTLDIGEHTTTVVCGATNMKTGDRVPIALPGAVLPRAGEIKEATLRGVASAGMLCSAWELGLGDDRSGLMILPQDAPAGSDLAEYLNISDTILDVEITPNRADCLSHLGIAREVAAMTGGRAALPDIRFPEEGEPIEQHIGIEIVDPDLCFRYAARIITGVTIGPSPAWLASRLESVGIRSINNVVDVTNFVLMETGQPLHAFDYDLLRKKRIIVRPAWEKEVFTTLDGVERTMDPSMLMIADAERSVALAGVMGGMESEVTENTTNLLIESAIFNPTSIRNTSRRLGLSTEASQRFERGIDPERVVPSADRATQLILQLAGGRAAKGALDVYPRPIIKDPVRLRPKRANMIIGLDLPAQAMEDILTGLSFVTLSRTTEHITVQPPSFRQDVSEEIDLVEEIARFYGYNRIPTTIPGGSIPMTEKMSKDQRIMSMTRDILVGAGLSEVVNFSFTKKGLFDNIKIGMDDNAEPVPISNPLTEEHNSLRPSVIPGLIQNLIYNLSRQNPDLKIFELSTCFFPSEEKAMPVTERIRLGIAMMGRNKERHWRIPERNVDIYDIRGVIELLLEEVGIREFRLEPASVPWLEEGGALHITDGTSRFGIVGYVSGRIREYFDLKKPALVAELDFDGLVERAQPGEYTFEALPKFPPVLRDLAIIIDKRTTFRHVLDLIQEEGGELLRDVSLFDIYVGRQIPEGKKSLAFSLMYRSESRTLTDEEVNEVHQRIIDRLCSALGAELR